MSPHRPSDIQNFTQLHKGNLEILFLSNRGWLNLFEPVLNTPALFARCGCEWYILHNISVRSSFIWRILKPLFRNSFLLLGLVLPLLSMCQCTKVAAQCLFFFFTSKWSQYFTLLFAILTWLANLAQIELNLTCKDISGFFLAFYCFL